jgi:rare lipoprotein A
MMVRSGAAICAAAAMFVYSSSAFADGGIASLGSYAAKEVAIGSVTKPEPRSSHAGDLPKSLELNGEKKTRPNAADAGAPIRGAASTYNPFRPGWREGGPETASGERYDAAAWTAAIKTTLRAHFGGVRFGKDYRPAYALVASADKQVIVKINDVGPLVPGRVIDLNERTMRYFDPSLQRGVIPGVTVTPLLGTDWTPGPVEATAENLAGFADNVGIKQF